MNMSEKLEKNPSEVQSNKEIIDELTKDLKSECVIDEENKNTDIPVNDEENSSSSSAAEDQDDYVNEERLKDLEVTLSDEDKEKNRQESIDLKNKGNQVFKTGEYLESLKIYTEALNICPLSCPTERSMLYSNRAATKSKLSRNESAIEDCSEAIKLNENYIRALLRRAQLYEQTNKLDEALGDYKKVLELDPSIMEARKAIVDLPPKIEARNEAMKQEMMGKLKDLGNMILRPFGLSTDNFQLQQDPNTGGYSVNFQQRK